MIVIDVEKRLDAIEVHRLITEIYEKTLNPVIVKEL